MNKKEKIDPGGVQIDAYWVPSEEVEDYVATREELAKRATALFQTFCEHVSRDWAGSEDGEAVVGYDADYQIKALVHLDPMAMQWVDEYPAVEEFNEVLLAHNEYTVEEWKQMMKEKSQE